MNSKPENRVKRLVIIGGGAAGMEAARTARQLDSDVEILVLTDERFPFYSRIHLSSFLADNPTFDELFIYDKDWYDEQKIQVRLQTPVIAINPRKNLVKDVFGKSYEYDRLIITAGAHPFLPQVKGMGKEGVHILRTLDDALRIKEFAKSCNSAVVIGGGILGVESASSFRKIGLETSIVELGDHLMPLLLDEKASSVLQNDLENRGIRIFLANAVQEICSANKADGVVLTNGEKTPGELILIAAGIAPNLELIRESGIRVSRGILVDEHLKTNFDNIYAAGDIAQFRDIIFGIWPAAVEQGIAAAKNALGTETIYNGTIPLHILKVAGIEMTAIGLIYKVQPNEVEYVYLDRESGKYLKIIHNGEFILGSIILGIDGLSFRIERMIKRKKPITPYLEDLEADRWDVLRKKKI